MPSHVHSVASAVVTLFLVASTQAAVTTLYSGNALPADEGFTYVPLGIATQTPVAAAQGGGVILDTTATNGTYAGYFRQLVAGTLGAPFTLDFQVGIRGDSFTNPLRAGFSMLVLTSDHTGIELGFHSDSIFAQNVGFATAGESVNIATSLLRHYQLNVSNGQYTLVDGDVVLLSGALRDYSATSTPFGPIYSSQDFLFFGDDTSSASGAFQLASVTLTTVPEPVAATMAVPALLLLRRCRRR